MSTQTLTRKGQTTISKGSSKATALHLESHLELVSVEACGVRMRPASIDASESPGMFKPPVRQVSVEAMNRAIRNKGGRR